ncbi:unnamed protein product [Meloidogyne enterolobii]|uniref:Uncharacterized protein n=1 Tax=Meloidogyne enterolobii TaxID=390850 RepID=A0ACB1A0H5_MELEN
MTRYTILMDHARSLIIGSITQITHQMEILEQNEEGRSRGVKMVFLNFIKSQEWFVSQPSVTTITTA